MANRVIRATGQALGFWQVPQKASVVTNKPGVVTDSPTNAAAGAQSALGGGSDSGDLGESETAALIAAAARSGAAGDHAGLGDGAAAASATDALRFAGVDVGRRGFRAPEVPQP